MSDSENSRKYPQFDPQLHSENLLEAFNEYLNGFDYAYQAIAKDPPTTATTAEARAAWTNTNKRKIFLGKFATRNLQKEYEETTTEQERSTLGFTEMVTKFRERFRLSGNSSLANYKFRKLVQNSNESFDLFVIRVKKESSSCNFKCTSAACTVTDVMVCDQIIFGTSDYDIRRQALHEEWDLETLIKKGRSLEAATMGAEKIKSGGSVRFKKEEGEYSGARRTQPKKYSKKYDPNKGRPTSKRPGATRSEKHPSTDQRCERCSSTKCKGGKHCAGNAVTCFACNKKGHYRGAKICKKRTSARRLESDSDTDSSDYTTPPEDSLSESEASSTESEEEVARHSRRVKRPIIFRVGGLRKTSKYKKKKLGKYEVMVVMNGKEIRAYADTGADVCIMSLENARKMNLPMQKTKMKIRPYGSKAKRCTAHYTGTIMFGDAVTNANI